MLIPEGQLYGMGFGTEMQNQFHGHDWHVEKTENEALIRLFNMDFTNILC